MSLLERKTDTVNNIERGELADNSQLKGDAKTVKDTEIISKCEDSVQF